jgi:hypothetical protein
MLDYYIPTLIIIYPIWKIFLRAGFSPYLSLVTLVPYLGWLIAALILAFGQWPAKQGRGEGA